MKLFLDHRNILLDGGRGVDKRNPNNMCFYNNFEYNYHNSITIPVNPWECCIQDGILLHSHNTTPHTNPGMHY